MNFDEAEIMANEINAKCGLNSLSRHKQSRQRKLEDLGIDDEGYCVFCEDFKGYYGGMQRRILFFIKTRKLDLEELGNHLIIF
jgi:hypothetical protein